MSSYFSDNKDEHANRAKENGNLVLTLSVGEGIYIIKKNETPVYLFLSENKGNARLAFSADRRYLIIREELIRKNHPSILEKLMRREIVTEDLYKTLKNKII